MIGAYIRLLRPRHWVKNLFLFAAPFFGGTLFREDILLLAFPVFLSFSLCASSVYIINDILDREKDRHHPKKRQRPVASGAISPRMALSVMLFLLIPSLYLSLMIERGFFLYIVLYLLIQMAYSIRFKNIAILDIFCIAAGFVIRVLAGGEAFNIRVSPWLFSTMFMISLVLASGKRLSETEELKENASLHRESLFYYSKGLLKSMLIISSSASLISYALYTIEQSSGLVYTLPVVTFGLFRYLLVSEKGLGDATEAMLRDRPLAVTVILWIAVVWFLRYSSV